MMQAVGILSLRMAEVEGGGAERWTVSLESSEEGKGEDTPPLAGVKTTHLSSLGLLRDEAEPIGSVRGREVSPVVHSMMVPSSIWPHPLQTLCRPCDFKSALAYGK